jgi:hypothetical protein
MTDFCDAGSVRTGNGKGKGEVALCIINPCDEDVRGSRNTYPRILNLDAALQDDESTTAEYLQNN